MGKRQRARQRHFDMRKQPNEKRSVWAARVRKWLDSQSLVDAVTGEWKWDRSA